MNSSFTYGKVKKHLKFAGLKPEALARIFNLEPDSLAVTDHMGQCYIPSGDHFDPQLQGGRWYTVYGVEKQWQQKPENEAKKNEN